MTGWPGIEDEKQPSRTLQRPRVVPGICRCLQVRRAIFLRFDINLISISYVFMNTDPAQDWALREKATKTAQDISEHIAGHLQRMSGSIVSPLLELLATHVLYNFFNQLSVSGFSDTLSGFLAGRKNYEVFLKQLLAARRTHPAEQIAASLFLEVVPTAAAYSKAVAHVVNFFLDEGRSEARKEIATLANLRTIESEAKILEYVYEALRK